MLASTISFIDASYPFFNTDSGSRILFDIDVVQCFALSNISDTHLNVRKDKYLTLRNRLPSGNAGPAKILMV